MFCIPHDLYGEMENHVYFPIYEQDTISNANVGEEIQNIKETQQKNCAASFIFSYTNLCT